MAKIYPSNPPNLMLRNFSSFIGLVYLIHCIYYFWKSSWWRLGLTMESPRSNESTKRNLLRLPEKIGIFEDGDWLWKQNKRRVEERRGAIGIIVPVLDDDEERREMNGVITATNDERRCDDEDPPPSPWPTTHHKISTTASLCRR